MRQSSDFYLSMAKKQQDLLEKYKRTPSWTNLSVQTKNIAKIEASLPSLDTKADEDHPYQNIFQGIV